MSFEVNEPDAYVLTLARLLELTGKTLDDLDIMGDRDTLTASEDEEKPCPPKIKGKRWMSSTIHLVERIARNKVVRAQTKENTEVFGHFDFGLATQEANSTRNAYLKKVERNAPPKVTIWNDNVPRRAMSSDGYDLLVHVPNGVTQVKEMTELVLDYGRTTHVKIIQTADQHKRNSHESYRFAEGELTGVAHLKEKMVVSKDIIRAGYVFSATTDLFRSLAVLSHQINAYLMNIDPKQFESLTQLREAGNQRYPHLEALGAIDPLLMEGRAIIFNRQTERHPDVDDPLNAWAALVILGHLTEGFFYIPALNLKVRYKPGDVVWIRGRILEHEVTPWVGGQRICLAHFTHSSFFREMSIPCETGLGVPPMDTPVSLSNPGPTTSSSAGSHRRRGKRSRGGRRNQPEGEQEHECKRVKLGNEK